jgi:uronate dehydrogenase
MRILMTGASGSVGQQLRPHLAMSADELILTSRSPLHDLRPNERWVAGDLGDADLFDRLLPGVDGVIHMAGLVGPDYTFDECLDPNFAAVHRLFAAVRRHGVRRTIYASTHHAVGFRDRSRAVDHLTPPRPDSWYGLTKAAGELIASLAADRYGLDVMTIRIGYVAPTVPDERRLHTWCSARDLAALIRIGLTGPQRGHHLVYGISRCPEPLFDNRHAESLGYVPQDASLDHLADPAIATERPDPANPAQRCIGGHFALPAAAGRD